jgi:hypothetical protein
MIQNRHSWEKRLENLRIYTSDLSAAGQEQIGRLIGKQAFGA